jgi:UDP-glucose 4-epimerase
MKVLLTGGAGYIGSHTAIALTQAGLSPVILDNFSNSNPEVLHRLKTITGLRFESIQGDVADVSLVKKIIKDHQVRAVIHLAADKAVGESVQHPVKYFKNNIGGLVGLLSAIQHTDCRNFVYSSSATVYGEPNCVPIAEESAVGYTNPYAQTKIIGEQILQTVAQSNTHFRLAILRYFNPAGAHESGLIGEDPSDTPNNLVPYLAQVAIGRRPRLQVFGNDYPTPDGTGIRDYIHVMDLAQGHVASLKALEQHGSHLVNLGAGRGYSVLEVIRAYGIASNREIPYEIVGRRSGDIATCFADPALANQLLQWRAKRGLTEICESSWKWQSQNPNGYLG